MTVMDILEFRDMTGPAPMPKSGVMRSNKVRWAILSKPFMILVLAYSHFSLVITIPDPDFNTTGI